jgi:hypothetical protein
MVLTVRNDKGKPAGGLAVRLAWPWATGSSSGAVPCGEATTDGLGRATISNLATGEYLVLIYSAKGRTVPAQQRAVVASDQTDTHVSITVTVSAIVAGRVIDSRTNLPIKDVRVGFGRMPADATDVASLPRDMTSRTDAHGNYLIPVAPGNTFAAVDRAFDGTPDDDRLQPSHVEFDAVSGTTNHAPDLRVIYWPVLTFVMPDGAPAADVHLYIRPAGSGGTMTLTLGTDASLPMDIVQAGEFRADEKGYMAAGTFRWEPDRPLSVSSNGSSRAYQSGVAVIRLTSRTPAAIVGKVVGEGGAPIADAIVRLKGKDPTDHSTTADWTYRTDHDGNFNVPISTLDSEYALFIHKDGLNQVNALAGVTYHPVAGDVKNLDTVVLTPASGVLTGRVVDDAGVGVAGMVVEVTGAKTLSSAAVTEADGSFRVGNLVANEPLKVDVYAGQVSDSGEPQRHAYDDWYRTSVSAGMSDLLITLKKADIGRTIAVPSQ